MNAEEKNNEVDINDVAITVEVGSGTIDRVRKGETTHITVPINEDNQSLFLEKIQFLVLSDGTDDCLVIILSMKTEAIGEVEFEIVPLLAEPKKYLMRWNPSISSFTESDYENCLGYMVHGMFRMNWSIYEWEEARRGDMFYMLRVGDGKAGIAFSGLIVSDPYVMDDWAGSSKRRLYVDLVCMNAIAPDEKPIVSLEMLQTSIPEFNWAKGHSGILLPDNVAEKIVGLMDKDAPLLN